MMIRRALIAIALLGLGWVAGRAQGAPQPDFVLDLESTAGGWTIVTCSRGCELIGSRDHVPNATRNSEYRFRCSADTCKATAFGWKKD